MGTAKSSPQDPGDPSPDRSASAICWLNKPAEKKAGFASIGGGARVLANLAHESSLFGTKRLWIAIGVEGRLADALNELLADLGEHTRAGLRHPKSIAAAKANAMIATAIASPLITLRIAKNRMPGAAIAAATDMFNSNLNETSIRRRQC